VTFSLARILTDEYSYSVRLREDSMKYRITNTHSGQDLGIFEGASEQDALDVMAVSLGFADHKAACAVFPITSGELKVEAVEGTIVTIVNVFHNTKTTTRVPPNMRISKARVERLRRRLCGVKNCCCGGDLSERGSSGVPAIVDANGEYLMFAATADGGEFIHV
jgi:hypothetical protein